MTSRLCGIQPRAANWRTSASRQKRPVARSMSNFRFTPKADSIRKLQQVRKVPTRDVCARLTICPLQPEADVLRGTRFAGTPDLRWRSPINLSEYRIESPQATDGSILAKRLADRGDVNVNRTLADGGARPHPFHQMVLGDEFAGRLHEDRDDLEGPAA